MPRDQVIEVLRSLRIPIDRVSYLRVKYSDEIPYPWTPELEAELPEELQDWRRFSL